MKTIIRIVIAAYLLPGLLFDLTCGIALLETDGSASGNALGEWLFALFNSFPYWVRLTIMPSIWICAIPAGLIVLGGLLALVMGLWVVMMYTGAAILRFPFTGKWQWNLD